MDATGQGPRNFERYSRQILYRPVGRSGQEKLGRSRAAIVGCGALGGYQAAALARAGIGELIVIDRDYVEESNLQRQCLFDERDAADSTPKALAAEAHLREMNSSVSVRGIVADLDSGNAAGLLSGINVLLDGTDNFATRYLLNDASIQRGFPWIYGAAVGSYGITMTIVPGATACLACVFPEPPSGMQPTCETEGILGAAASAVASIQVAEAMKLLVGDLQALHRKLISFDLWENRFQAVDPGLRAEGCRACVRRDWVHLAGESAQPVRLCGRNSVQIHEGNRAPDFQQIASRLENQGAVRFNRHVLRFAAGSFELTVFADGRTIIKGTEDAAEAKRVYARYIG